VHGRDSLALLEEFPQFKNEMKVRSECTAGNFRHFDALIITSARGGVLQQLPDYPTPTNSNRDES